MAGLAELGKEAGVKKDVVEEIFNSILILVEDGDKVIIRGFGTFARTTSEARTGRNPMTGASVEIPAKSKLHFKAAKETVVVLETKKKAKKK